MDDLREVKTYGQRLFVSNELLRQQRSRVRAMLQSDLEYKCRREGYEPLPNTFTAQFWDADDPMWRPDDPDWLMCRDHNASMARISLRCYQSDAPSP